MQILLAFLATFGNSNVSSLVIMPSLYCAAGLRKPDPEAIRRKRLLITSIFAGLLIGAVTVAYVWALAQTAENAVPTNGTFKTPLSIGIYSALFFLLFSPVHALLGNWMCKWSRRK